MEVGLYGKLPSHGDFLRRRVADDFVTAWDAWLQQSIAASRATLGEGWLDTYLTSPVWRFALTAGVCGSAGVAGVLVPSVDRVGRYFPMTLVWPTNEELTALEVALRYEPLFERADRLLIDALGLDQLDFAAFDQQVIELGAVPLAGTIGGWRLVRDSARSVLAAVPGCWRIPLHSVASLQGTALQLLAAQWEALHPTLGLWWTDGSAVVEPSWLVARGLPDADAYTAMLDGHWSATAWLNVEAVRDADIPAEAPESLAALEPGGIHSAGRSEQGPVRASNQDAFLDRADLGLWAVADGLGGLSDGEIASRMVCDALADTPVVPTLEERTEGALEQLRRVNDYLRRAATRAVNPRQSASTVVALLIRQKECAVIWAGDSRAYRLRDGMLSQMTTDHRAFADAAASSGASQAEVAQAISRAVGGEDELELDIVRSDVRPGDRFLLCSDGLARVLDDSAITEILRQSDVEHCCAQLLSEAIAQGTTDNATAVVVDCVSVVEMADTLANVGP